MVGETDKTLADELRKLKYQARKPEELEVAMINSGDRPNTCREPAKMAPTFENDDRCLEGTSPNEEGRDDLKGPVELGYPLLDAETYDWTIQNLIMDDFQDGDLWIQMKMNKAQIFAQRYTEDKKELPLKEQIPKEFHQYLAVFSKEASEHFPEKKSWDHKIEMKPGFEPKAQKAFSLPQDEVKLAEAFVKENLEKGYIQPSQSPQSSPLFFVNKKDGGKRPCQDYRYLNEWTIKNAYSLPLIQDLIDGLQGMKYFTKLDIQWGYNNIRIRKGDEWKAAFRTPQGLFEPTVMFFGLCNSPATFQSIMDKIFNNKALQGWLKKYMDDILIAAKTQEELKERTLLVLKKL